MEEKKEGGFFFSVAEESMNLELAPNGKQRAQRTNTAKPDWTVAAKDGAAHV